VLGPVHSGPRNFGARKDTRTLGFAYVEHAKYVIGGERGAGELGLRTVERVQGKALKRRGRGRGFAKGFLASCFN
jgi:hypothetical protein